jgi:cell wall-associated NlpC family hydrolase
MLGVAQGTTVDAVTAGTLKVIPVGAGTATIVLSGTDGATYTYSDISTTEASRTKVSAGAQIGVSGPRGLTFSISVPDVRGAVDADEALQAWASGLTVDVRALPSTITPASVERTRRQVLLVTDAGAGATASELAKSLAGPLVTARAEAVSDSDLPGGQATTAPRITTAPHIIAASQIATVRQIAAATDRGLVVVALADGTPARAAALAARLPAGHDLLWVAPPGTTSKQAAAYRAIVAAHPGFRVESLPTALAAVNTTAVNTTAVKTTAVKTTAVNTTAVNTTAVNTTAAGATADAKSATASQDWSPTGALATATLVSTYASTAFRLESVSPQARTVVSWAEEQLGKPYQYAAAGPDSFDCSGLTMDALAQAGITVTHNADAQWRQTKAHQVGEAQLALGDLVFFAGSDGTLTAPGHVGIYVGDGEIIDAPFTGANVRFDSLTGIGGYVGATDPYASSPASSATTVGGTVPVTVPASPGALNQYQSFAETLANATWGAGQFPYLYMLWERESGWDPTATNPLSGAYGIPQALPAVKMASAGLDWQTDPYTQIIWGIGYIKATYGTPQAAWAHELTYGWY